MRCNMIRHTRWFAVAVLSAPLCTCWAAPVSFVTPSDDRWFYPFNFTPGGRPVGTCFGAGGTPNFNDRDAEVVVVWNTAASIATGLGADAYGIRSVRVTLTNQK